MFLYYEVIIGYDEGFNQLEKKFNLLRHLPAKEVKRVEENHYDIYRPISKYDSNEKDKIKEHYAKYDKIESLLIRYKREKSSEK